MSWQAALLCLAGALLVAGVIAIVVDILRSRRREILNAPHFSVGRDCYKFTAGKQ